MKSNALIAVIILLTGFIAYHFFFKPKNPLTEAENIPKLMELGLLKMDTDTTLNFSIVNTGDNDLQLKNVIPGCYCTVVNNWTREMILPGDTARIRLGFKPNGPGYFQETATVGVNTKEGAIILAFRGKVE